MHGPSQLSTPLYSQLIFRIYAAMNGLGGGAKTEFFPGPGKSQVRHWPQPPSTGLVYSTFVDQSSHVQKLLLLKLWL